MVDNNGWYGFILMVDNGLKLIADNNGLIIIVDNNSW